MIYFHEVFYSIQGESTDAGLPCVFVRLYGCNLRCAYCDQPQQPSDRKRISVDNLISDIRKFMCKNICITGGEPLMQEEIYSVIYDLTVLGYNVSVETNGAVAIDADVITRKFKYVMDVKCPSSKMAHKNIYDNLANLQSHDEVKFVIADREDYDFMKEVIRKYPTKAKILVSPMFDYQRQMSIGSQLIEWILKDKLNNVRVQIQMHKILGVL